MMKNRLAGLIIAAALLVGVSCATGQKVPSWVLSTPVADSANTYFVGSGPGPDSGSATAEATSNLIANIMQYIGVAVKVDTSATAKASLDSYSAEIRQTVETQSTNRLAGFKVLERYSSRDKATGRYVVHILASYSTADLRKEKARIEGLFQEKIDAVAKPEAEGDALAAAGRVIDAATKYIEAMVAASGSDIDNAEIKVERNANKAREQIAQLRFSFAGPAEIKASLGKAPGSALAVQVLAGRGGENRPVQSVPLLVSIPRKLPNGRMGTKQERLRSDALGWASFALPAPDFVGKAKILVSVDFSSTYDLFDKVGKKYSAFVSSLEDEMRNKMGELSYVVVSEAARIPIAVYMVDFDDRGSLMPSQTTQSGLVEALTKEGFSISALPLDPGYAKAPLELVLAAARSSGPRGTPRLAIGQATVQSVRQEGAYYLATVAGSVKVVSIADGAVLFSSDSTWQSLASDPNSAVRAAFRELGSNIFGKNIVSSLP
jgi:hypothetical protein